MDSDSPGRPSLEDDIEMIEIDKVHEARQNTQLKFPPTPDDSDDEDHGTADDARALLNDSTDRAFNAEWPAKQSQKLWPQVKGIVLESAPTLLLTAISLLFTGKLLDKVARWRAMQEVDQLIMIIPTVLNLNGNLEMNLSARLGTAANVGELDDARVLRSMISGSLALLQLQTISVSFIASVIALLLGRLVPRTISLPSSPSSPSVSNATASIARELLNHSLDPRQDSELARKSGIPTFIMVASTAMTAAAFSGLILGSFMCTLIVLCRKYDRDPDNIAPAVASCLGDLFTLVLVGLVSNLLIPFLHTPVPFSIGVLVMAWAVCCGLFAYKNETVRPLIKEGWSPLFVAMAISSGTGIVLDMFVSRYEGFAILAIVISGLPGAAGSILVSRLSTALHAAALTMRNTLPSYSTSTKQHPDPSPGLTMVILLVITVPVEMIFLAVLNGLGWLKLPILFVMFSIIFFCCAVLVSLIVARVLTNFLWSINRDPDLYALPVHSALMDLVGQLLLVLCFEIVSRLGITIRSKS